MSKVSARAFASGMARADEKKNAAAENSTAPSKGSGNFTRMAMASMEEELKKARDLQQVAQTTLVQGIVSGHIPVEISVEQIIDEVGSDRITETPDDEEDTESFKTLVENIRDRGLRTPIRVRPQDPSWQPSDEEPRNVAGKTFVLQSGRRRLAACKELGIAPRAFISFEEGDTRFNDLKERFYENAARKNLNVVEKLYSIGLLANGMEGLTYDEIAEALGVSPAYVSRGIGVIEFFDQLSADLELSSARTKDIDAAIKTYRAALKASQGQSERATKRRESYEAIIQREKAALPFNKRDLKTAKVSLKVNARGERVLAVQGSALEDEVIEKILNLLEAS